MLVVDAGIPRRVAAGLALHLLARPEVHQEAHGFEPGVLVALAAGEVADVGFGRGRIVPAGNVADSGGQGQAGSSGRPVLPRFEHRKRDAQIGERIGDVDELHR